MAQETREIALTNKESLLALDSYRRAMPGFLPGGEIVRFHMKSDGDIIIVVKMDYGKTHTEMEIDYKLLDLMPVLIQFCSENNVQVPSHGKRCIKCENDALSLLMVSEV